MKVQSNFHRKSKTLALQVQISYTGTSKEMQTRGQNQWTIYLKKTSVLCILETKLSKQTYFNLQSYNGFFKEGHTNPRAPGEVAIFIKETIPYQKLILNTPLQALAARNNIGRDVTKVSIYNSHSQAKNENLLSTLFHQLPKPVILRVPFSSYHQIWGSPAIDSRRCQVLSFFQQKPTKHFKRRKTHKNIEHLNIGNYPHNSIPLFTAHPNLECHTLSFKYRPLCNNRKGSKHKF